MAWDPPLLALSWKVSVPFGPDGDSTGWFGTSWPVCGTTKGGGVTGSA